MLQRVISLEWLAPLTMRQGWRRRIGTGLRGRRLHPSEPHGRRGAGLRRRPFGKGRLLEREAHQLPVLGIDVQGSAGGSNSPCWMSSIEMPSGERMKAMWPSRGGRLMVTPLSMSDWHSS